MIQEFETSNYRFDTKLRSDFFKKIEKFILDF